MKLDLATLQGFGWDSANLAKNPRRHDIDNNEAEEVFLRSPVLADATRPADNESRWYALGPYERGRILRIVFTVRGSKIRVISARPASRKERKIYAQAVRPL